MSSTKVLRRRIKSVSSTKQITKAMELVAAAKMKRIQSAATGARAYTETARTVLQHITHTSDSKNHPYFKAATSKTKLYVVFGSDRGLAGAFISGLQHALTTELKQDQANGILSEVIVYGKRVASYVAQLKNVELSAIYSGIADIPEASVFAPLVQHINEGAADSKYLEVVLIYTEFVSTVCQSVKVHKVLPISDLPAEPNSKTSVYTFEPSEEEVLTIAAQLYIQSQIMQARLDSAASEYAMRMLAMHNASQNATDLISEFRLELNATRQASITQEIAEISGGMAAITGANT